MSSVADIAIESFTDLLIALLYAPGRTGAANEPIEGRTRIQKLLFLLQQAAVVHQTQHVRPSNLAFPSQLLKFLYVPKMLMKYQLF